MTPQQTLENEAAEWAVAMDRGLTSAERSSLEQWLAGSPRRQGALVRAQAVWRAAAGESPAHIAVGKRVGLRGMTTRRLLAGGLAAGFAITAGITLFAGRADNYRTGDLEVRRVAMDDGSEAVLNSDTRLNVRYSAARRQVAMRNGEAWFDVAKDASRPFVVTTPEVQVTAVGTAFSVRKSTEVTEVMVTEGVVRIDRKGQSPLRVSAGGRVRIAAGHPVESRLDAGSVQRRLAWREGLIMLDGETLGEAADEFNQYNARKLRIAPDIAGRKVVGVFRKNDIEGFARANSQLMSVDINLYADEIFVGNASSSHKLHNK